MTLPTMAPVQTTNGNAAPARDDRAGALRCPLCGGEDTAAKLDAMRLALEAVAAKLDKLDAAVNVLSSAALTIAGHLSTIRADGWRAWRKGAR